jgi:large subunit ribosomal protein L19
MSLEITHKEVSFGIGDKVKVSRRIKEGGKERVQIFEGTVLAINNRGVNKSFLVRRIGAQKVGIEMIFPLESPFLEKIEVVKKGTSGVKHAKIYYVRKKSAREIEKIYSRQTKKELAKEKGHAQNKSSKSRKSR